MQTTEQPVTCDQTVPNGQGRPDHDYVMTGEEYGGLAAGGDYEIYDCRNCGRRVYSQLPD